MTGTQANDPSTTPPKGLTNKQRQAIGVAGLALCLLVGCGVVWWFLFGSSPTRKTVSVDPAQQDTRMPGQRSTFVAPRPNPRGINKLADDRWFARTDSGSLVIITQGSGYNFEFQPNLKLPPDQLKILTARVRIISDPLMAKQWGISPDQVEKLRQMGATKIPDPPAQDKSELVGLFSAFSKADTAGKVDAEKKVIDKASAALKNAQGPALQAYSDRTEQVKKILTPQQIETIVSPNAPKPAA